MFNKIELETKMKKAIEALENNLKSIRTGRASPAFLENVKIDAYDQKMKLNEIASISIVDNFTLSVNPWDKELNNTICTGIQSANLGVNPIMNGLMIIVPMPRMTEERRKEMVKIVAHYGEDGKISIRNIRREANDDIKKSEKNKEISEDERDRNESEVQRVFDHFAKIIDDLVKKKGEEVMSV